jgi:hypothetical protein
MFTDHEAAERVKSGEYGKVGHLSAVVVAQSSLLTYW